MTKSTLVEINACIDEIENLSEKDGKHILSSVLEKEKKRGANNAPARYSISCGVRNQRFLSMLGNAKHFQQFKRVTP